MLLRLLAASSPVACLALSTIAWAQEPRPRTAERPELEMARACARWLDAQLSKTDAGPTWPVDPEQPGRRDAALYAGIPGILLFLVELHAATGEPQWLERATSGARALLTSDGYRALVERKEYGLYTGIAGTGFAVEQVARAADDDRLLRAAADIASQVVAGARSAGNGVEWNDVTDVIYGGAGIGLYLLDHLEHHPEDVAARRAVLACGARLVALGEPIDGAGIRWRMSRQRDVEYPNFSHGTAGVGFFLARLHGLALEHDEALAERLLVSAEGAANRLDSLTDSDTGLVPHHLPGGDALHYLGWCHGPTGSVRLYQQLAVEHARRNAPTAATRHASRADAVLAALLGAKVPARSEGFWNNAGWCCGTAGVLDVVDAWHDRDREAATEHDLAEVRARLVADLHIRARVADGRASWVHAEHRARPKLLGAQTGLMQGAAGIGLVWLRLDARATGRTAVVRLPDEVRSTD